MPLLLAGVYQVFGVDSPAAVLAFQLLQCAAGTALVLCVVWLARSLVHELPAVAWIAGWGAALYPIHVYAVTHVQAAPWAALLLTLLLAIVASARKSTDSPRSLYLTGALAGLTAGVMLLVEPILALSIPFAAWMLYRKPRRVLPVAVMAAAAALVVTPWLVRNRVVHGEFVFVKSTFGYAFWQGNNPASWGTDKIPKPNVEEIRNSHDGTLASCNRALWEARHETLYIDDVLLKPAGYARFAGLSEPARSRLLGDEAWRFLRAEPLAYLGLCAKRLQYFLLWDETNPKTAALPYRAATLAWLIVAAAGLWCSRPWWPRLWPLVAIFASVALFHCLTIVSARFRIPLEPLSFVWAACVFVRSGRVGPDVPLPKLRSARKAASLVRQ